MREAGGWIARLAFAPKDLEIVRIVRLCERGLEMLCGYEVT